MGAETHDQDIYRTYDGGRYGFHGGHDETADSASARVAWHTERVHAAADYWRPGE